MFVAIRSSRYQLTMCANIFNRFTVIGHVSTIRAFEGLNFSREKSTVDERFGLPSRQQLDAENSCFELEIPFS